jgi:hypothetical protein
MWEHKNEKKLCPPNTPLKYGEIPKMDNRSFLH